MLTVALNIPTGEVVMVNSRSRVEIYKEIGTVNVNRQIAQKEGKIEGVCGLVDASL